MLACNISRNLDSYGYRERAWFCLKAIKGLCKETVKQNERRMLFVHKNAFMYWSSSENNDNNAWNQNFNNGNQNNNNKNNDNNVRCVRDFKQDRLLSPDKKLSGLLFLLCN
jgi:hypothetical protein